MSAPSMSLFTPRREPLSGILRDWSFMSWKFQHISTRTSRFHQNGLIIFSRRYDGRSLNIGARSGAQHVQEGRYLWTQQDVVADESSFNKRATGDRCFSISHLQEKLG